MAAPDKLTLAKLARGDLEGLAERLLAENAALKRKRSADPRLPSAPAI